jgi:hypothetical protein
MSKKQKHHYIPEFYLKQWAGSDGQLIEYCRRYQGRIVARPTAPGGTGYVPGLYSIPGALPQVENIFETSYLAKADGLAAHSLTVMLNDHYVPTGPEKTAWTRFIMSLIYRTPEGVARSVDIIRKFYEEDSLEEIRKVYDHLKRPDDPPTPEEYVKLNSERMTSRTTMRHLLNIIESEAVRDKIMSMQWHLGYFNGLKYKLLTSDRPIVMTNGIDFPNSHLVMPISPTHIFIATNTTEEAEKIKALSKDGQIVGILNDKMVRQARRFAYGIDKSQTRFVENRLGDKIPCSPFE